MKLIITLLLSSFGVFSLAAPSQDEKEYEGWMKATGATVGSLRNHLERRQPLECGRFETALVVHFGALAMMEGKPTAFLVPDVCRIQNDYQSGLEAPALQRLRRSDLCAGLILLVPI